MEIVEMRALIFGQSGVNKQSVVDKLAIRFHALHPREELTVIHFERKIVDRYGRFPGTVVRVAADIDGSFREDWKRSFNAVNEAYKNHPNVIVILHAAFYRQYRFICPADVKALQDFKPDVCITLIDDIFDIWSRLNTAYCASPEKGYFRLDEIAMWRTAELSIADMLAEAVVPDNGKIKNYLFAVKHPVDTLYRLLFKRDQFVRIYACCGITKPRKTPVLRKKVDKYRTSLEKDYIVFDPLTIDESIIKAAYIRSFPNEAEQLRQSNPPVPEGNVRIFRNDRWPLTKTERLSYGVFENNRIRDIAIPAAEVVRLLCERDGNERSVINDQITQRDLRLIDQSDLMPAWRPYFGGSMAGGQRRELAHVGSTVVPSVIWWPDEDGPRMENLPLNEKSIYASTEARLFRLLRTWADEVHQSRFG